MIKTRTSAPPPTEVTRRVVFSFRIEEEGGTYHFPVTTSRRAFAVIVALVSGVVANSGLGLTEKLLRALAFILGGAS